jgi:hypothetical protein
VIRNGNVVMHGCSLSDCQARAEDDSRVWGESRIIKSDLAAKVYADQLCGSMFGVSPSTPDGI